MKNKSKYVENILKNEKGTITEPVLAIVSFTVLFGVSLTIILIKFL